MAVAEQMRRRWDKGGMAKASRLITPAEISREKQPVYYQYTIQTEEDKKFAMKS